MRAMVLGLLLAGCSSFAEAPRPTHPTEGVRKVVDSLGAEIAKRVESAAFRNLPIVVRTTTVANTGIEPIIAELLRTRLVERGLPVDAAQGTSVPVVGGLISTIGDQEREKEKAAGRASGLFVTLAARDGNRYTAREHVVAIISAGDIALE